MSAAVSGVSLTGRVYVRPTMIFAVDHIGETNIGIKAFVEQSISGPCTGEGRSDGTTYAANVGLQLTVGARLNISFADHVFVDKKFGPKEIVSAKWPIDSDCFHLPSTELSQLIASSKATLDVYVSVLPNVVIVRDHAMNPLTNGTYVDAQGMSYSGIVKRKASGSCADLPDMMVTFQMRGDPHSPGTTRWVGSANHNYVCKTASGENYNVGCIWQQVYQDGDSLEVPVIVDPYDAVTATVVSCGEINYYPPGVGGKNLISPNRDTMTIGSDDCYDEIVLRRQ